VGDRPRGLALRAHRGALDGRPATALTVASHSPPLPVDSVDDIAAALRRAGGRLTTARRVVLDALFAAKGPLSAEQIASGLEGRGTPSDLASVYRNLERLEQLGVVRHVHAGHGAGLYSLAGREPAEHLVCERCGRLTTVPAERLDAIRAQIQQEFGYHARFGHFPIHGICRSCMRKAAVSGGSSRAGSA
jgi:Fur family ferric uptake transcriptional regulator